MEAAIFEIAPQARVIHLMHGLPEYNVIAAARTLETLQTFPVGIHVCVCDPGVGTSRRAAAIKVDRGDVLVGPDNGVLQPAARILGGIVQARSIEDRAFMRAQVSPLFHGRDLFAPCAAHLASGARFEDLGPEIAAHTLFGAPYDEANISGGVVNAVVIQVNRFGSLHLNILHKAWDSLGCELGEHLNAEFEGHDPVELIFATTFGDVPQGCAVIMKDDYGRVEIAKNMQRFVDQTGLTIGSGITLRRALR